MRIIVFLVCALLMLGAEAGSPVWTFTPLSATTITVPSNTTAIVQYLVTNQSSQSHTLIMTPIPAVTQITGGAGICRAVFTLPTKGSSCTLSLQVDGSQLNEPINDGPIVCENANPSQCYRPSQPDALHITVGEPTTLAELMVIGSPLTLNANGATGDLTIMNTSLTTTALNITADFVGTALDGNVTETSSTCATVLPATACTLIFTPGSNIVPLTDFSISGNNTNTVLAAIEINTALPALISVTPSSGPISGGTGVTLSGSNLTGATSVTFGGFAATSVNVINSSTVTAVTPAHALGVVDVVIDAPQGNNTLVDGFSYLSTAVGQSADGGVIGCLNGGQDNFISSISDNSASVAWGGTGTATGATSLSDGTTNTAATVSALGAGTYAAAVCADHEIDSQGISPCQPGNTCYNDWFLPAKNQLNCLYTNQNAIGGFQSAIYWTSTEISTGANTQSYGQDLGGGMQVMLNKNITLPIRCVRAFVP